MTDSSWYLQIRWSLHKGGLYAMCLRPAINVANVFPATTDLTVRVHIHRNVCQSNKRFTKTHRDPWSAACKSDLLIKIDSAPKVCNCQQNK